jgi:glycosyltransferase involved in cell wall biosynthesis
MTRLKVIHLVEDLKIGGAERVIADIALGLDRKKYDASVWCVTRGGETASELSEKRIEVKVLGISSFRNPLNTVRLARLLQAARPDIVHTHGYFASVIGRLAARRAGTPIILAHVHSTYWEYKKRHIMIERKLSRFTHKIICCSQAVESFVTNTEKIADNKTIVIYNGVDEERFSPSKNSTSIRAEFGMDEEAAVVGTVSSLTPHKGHEYLIQAASLVLSTLPAARFLVVGDGPLRKKLEDQAKNLNIYPAVIFAGTRKDIPEILSLLDVFVLPSHTREGLGIAIIEAMAVERPVVASDIGGIPEVVNDSDTGLLVPPGDPEALAKATNELLQNPARAKEMGKKGRIRVKERFTAKKMLAEIEHVYQSLAGQRDVKTDEKA